MSHYASEQLRSANSSVLFQSQDGYLWVGSDQGLLRFDGQQFFPVQSRVMGSDSVMTFTQIHALAEDETGHLWIGTRRGLFRYDRRTEVSRFFGSDPNVPTMLDNPMVASLLIDRQQQLWVGTWDGLHRYLPDQEQFERIALPGIESRDLFLRSLFEDRSGRIWLGIRDQVLAYDPAKGDFRVYTPRTPYTPASKSNDIRRISQDPQGRIWLAGWGFGLQCLDPATDAWVDVTPQLLAHPQVEGMGNLQDICFDEQGNLWVNTLRGLFVREAGQAHFEAVHCDQSQHVQWQKLATLASLFDEQGNLWVSKTGLGLLKIPPSRQAFILAPLFRPDGQAPQTGLHITGIAEGPGGRIWINSDKGLGSPRPFAEGEAVPPGLRALSQQTQGKFMTRLAFGPDGDIWLGTRFEGLYHGHLTQTDIEVYDDRPGSKVRLTDMHINALMQDHAGSCRKPVVFYR
jgi:ligand-binding sensor domain-containing protein